MLLYLICIFYIIHEVVVKVPMTTWYTECSQSFWYIVMVMKPVLWDFMVVYTLWNSLYELSTICSTLATTPILLKKFAKFHMYTSYIWLYEFLVFSYIMEKIWQWQSLPRYLILSVIHNTRFLHFKWWVHLVQILPSSLLQKLVFSTTYHVLG